MCSLNRARCLAFYIGSFKSSKTSKSSKIRFNSRRTKRVMARVVLVTTSCTRI
jgi:hypothetical protein